YEWNNLADNPEYAKVKAQLKKQLAAWMKDQGDKGQQTEMEAYEHQNKGRSKKPEPSTKKKGGRKKK
ncbi:MAG: sulfatase atsG, partial [Planctomycetes bacterium]|nr:sulfatase atsG [Planctomycetota bacterium]